MHDMTKELKTGDRMFELMKSDKKLMEEKYNITVGGWCADQGPDTKKGKRLMGETFLWMIILACWAHQMNLVVGDLLGVKHKLIELIRIAFTSLHGLTDIQHLSRGSRMNKNSLTANPGSSSY